MENQYCDLLHVLEDLAPCVIRRGREGECGPSLYIVEPFNGRELTGKTLAHALAGATATCTGPHTVHNAHLPANADERIRAAYEELECARGKRDAADAIRREAVSEMDVAYAKVLAAEADFRAAKALRQTPQTAEEAR
jgi:hypothetical protein